MQSKRDDGFRPHPELLMAAQRGDSQQLERLLTKGGDAAAAAPQVVVDIEIEEAVITSGEAVTMAGDSVLHVVASRGDGEEFLKSATAIHGRSSRLLVARNKKGDTPLHCAARAGRGRMATHLVALASAENRNKKGDTPLHCAARAGWGGMVTHLVALASGENGDGLEKVKEFLRMQNEQGETALHEAVRLGSRDMVGQLLTKDPELARVPPADGASPLYLAVSLGHEDIARRLHEKDNALSYSGPDGRTALHAAVLKDKEMTKMLLEWNRDLIKQAERSTGSTALHFAASRGTHEMISLLLAADPSLAYQPDSNGSFPIHVAAFVNKVKAVSILLDDRHDCSELRDASGRTFLHVAVVEESQPVVRKTCRLQHQNFGSLFMNMQDNDGNTALHLAVQVGNLWIFNHLMENRLVKLNLTNNKGQTPLDLYGR